MSHDAPRVYILDSFAVLAFLNSEKGAVPIQSLMHTARQGHARLCLPMMNLGEVAYIVERERGLPSALQALAVIENQLPIELIEATRERVLAAAHIKANFRLSYADAFAVAAAQEFHGTLVSGDPELAEVESSGLVRVQWLAR